MTQPKFTFPVKIISGGQTGVDRAALDFAMAHEISVGGWIPRGRLTESGPLDRRYPLKETGSTNYALRTLWNARDSDATLIIASTLELSGGTAWTAECARQLGKPCCVLHGLNEFPTLVSWLERYRPRWLNIAGPRLSNDAKAPTICCELLEELLAISQGEQSCCGASES